MSAFEEVDKLVREWQPLALPTEFQYRNALIVLLRERLKRAKIEPEYRHKGTTIDIYVRQPGFLGSSEVFVELKRNLLQKSQYDRLVGQIESLEPGKNAIVVVLCGETNPSLVTRFRDKYEITDGPQFRVILSDEPITVVVKTVAAQSPHSSLRLKWPKPLGTYIAASSETIPPFPRSLSGYRSEEGKDFWNKPFPVKGRIRILQNNGWQGIPNFPHTMNGCSSGVFMIRWRSADPNVRLQSSTGYSAAVASQGAKTGVFGYMSATNCEQPMFTFGDSPAQDGSTLVDIYYELKFWQAAP